MNVQDRHTAMEIHKTSQPWSDGYFTSRDGLRLYGRCYDASGSDATPVLCLPGLTRNSRDFDPVARFLSSSADRPRSVYCIDYRGRGRSDRDPNWRNYTPFMELLDTLDFMTINGLHEVSIIGTSRGGIIAMLMAVMRPAAISACVLNDIGPVIETGGLARIIGYVGKIPTPTTWEDAARIVRTMNEQFFTDIPDSDWEAIARQIYADENGRPRSDYDEKLSNTMEEIDLSRKPPEMWPQFSALGQAPTLVLRGENSDLLSTGTLAEMARRHPRIETHTVPEQGHPPLLRDRKTMELVAEFLASADPA